MRSRNSISKGFRFVLPQRLFSSVRGMTEPRHARPRLPGLDGIARRRDTRVGDDGDHW
jgi:hypothetical protein